MDRRELLKMVSLATGGIVIGGEFFLSGCKNENAGAGITFSPDDIAFLNEVADTIIPTTATPGAKVANIGEFMRVMVTDCYTEQDQSIFKNGIKQIDEASNKAYNVGFLKASPEQRKALLNQLDNDAKAIRKENNAKEGVTREEAKKHRDKKYTWAPEHYFTMMKQLTLTGFFTSNTGATETLRYVAVPGRFEGCFPYKKGDKAWATT